MPTLSKISLKQSRALLLDSGGGSGNEGESSPHTTGTVAHDDDARRQEKNRQTHDSKWSVRLEELRQWQTHDSKWSVRLEELRQYKAKNGDSNVPQNCPQNPSLGPWVAKQRQCYRQMQEGKRSSMTAERVAALNEIGFAWRIKKGRNKRHGSSDAYAMYSKKAWKKRLEDLVAYRAQHGDVNVPQRYRPNPSLGSWVRNQRAEYRKMQQGEPSDMNAERMAALNEIGFVWKIKKPSWNERLEELRLFKAENGHTNVPWKYPQNAPLGTWVSNQRAQYHSMKDGKPTTMTAERAAALEKLGFIWNMLKQKQTKTAEL